MTRLEKIEKWATIAAALIAAVALMVTAWFSKSTLDASNEALRETRSQGWGVQGAQNCASYREQVQSLWEGEVPEASIRAWFATELGSAQNPYIKGGGQTALEDYESGCGRLKDLIAVLEAGAAPDGG